MLLVVKLQSRSECVGGDWSLEPHELIKTNKSHPVCSSLVSGGNITVSSEFRDLPLKAVMISVDSFSNLRTFCWSGLTLSSRVRKLSSTKEIEKAGGESW